MAKIRVVLAYEGLKPPDARAQLADNPMKDKL